MKKKKLRSAVPIYLGAAVWAIYALCFPLYTMRHITIAALLSLAVYIAGRILIKPKIVEVREPEPQDTPSATGNPEADAAIDRAKACVRTMKQISAILKDPYITMQVGRMTRASQAIFDVLADQPDYFPRARKFLCHYLPTTHKLLESYRKLSEKGISGENITGTMTTVKNSLASIAEAFEKQADSLYGDEALDITTDIEVLETMLKTEGFQ